MGSWVDSEAPLKEVEKKKVQIPKKLADYVEKHFSSISTVALSLTIDFKSKSSLSSERISTTEIIILENTGQCVKFTIHYIDHIYIYLFLFGKFKKQDDAKSYNGISRDYVLFTNEHVLQAKNDTDVDDECVDKKNSELNKEI